jgi:hypothetical protein
MVERPSLCSTARILRSIRSRAGGRLGDINDDRIEIGFPT